MCFEKITKAVVWRSDWKRITVGVGTQEGITVNQEQRDDSLDWNGAREDWEKIKMIGHTF